MGQPVMGNTTGLKTDFKIRKRKSPVNSNYTSKVR